uniref:HARP domain-containing protein n=1 Tax=Ciona savignyi TaxID=51511 RepID=H2Z049_CIOSA
MPNYTEEQKKRMEANRLRALRIRSEKAAAVKTATTGFGTTNHSKLQMNKPLYDTSNNKAFSPATSSNKHPQSVLQCTVIEGNRFSVTCSYNVKLVSAFKSIPSRRYDSITKKWNFSLSDHGPLGSKVKSVGFQLSNPENAVIVKSTEGGSTSVGLNDVNQNTTKCSGKCYLISSSRFEVEMPYHKEAVAVFKSLPTKLYDINSRRWNFDLSDYNLLMSSLKKEEGLFLEPLPSTVLEVFKSKISGGESKCPIQNIDLIDVDPKIVSSLMPFQKDGVNFAISKNGRVLLADDMGLGKTVQSICV